MTFETILFENNVIGSKRNCPAIFLSSQTHQFWAFFTNSFLISLQEQQLILNSKNEQLPFYSYLLTYVVWNRHRCIHMYDPKLGNIFRSPMWKKVFFCGGQYDKSKQLCIKIKDVPFISRNILPRKLKFQVPGKITFFHIGDLKMLPCFGTHHIYMAILDNYKFFLVSSHYSLVPSPVPSSCQLHKANRTKRNIWRKYQPSGAGGTRSPPATPHCLQHLTARLIQNGRRVLERG